MRSLCFFTFFFIFNVDCMNSQELIKHQWQNRIILLVADSFENDSLKDQKELLSRFSEELDERRLIIYEISPNYFRRERDSDHTELGTSTVFEKYNATNESFKIILIGLDGGTKFEKNNPVSPKILFDLIDTMPMRQNELRNN